ncbi:MAG: tRNA pseudouridine(13) synthase TruD [Gammaproteobacteria bacterium]|nr:tRNA pseudouridine(13) synthase TruD [Gammaproteobacteria bacterium]
MTGPHQYSLDFVRAHGKPLCSGIIRDRFEDFQVVEIPSYEITGEGEHCLLHIRKRGANTGWVATRIARFAGVRSVDVGYAGRKDRHADTTQWFSCWLPGRPDPDWQTLNAKGVEILDVRRHNRKLKKGALKANRFTIVIRELSCGNGGQPAVEERLEKIKEEGVPNYFGEQRFGQSMKNLLLADKLLKREIRIKDRQRKGLYLSAARSYLFNSSLQERVRDGSWCRRKESGGSAIGSLFGKGDFDSPAERKIEQQMSEWCEALLMLGMKRSYRALVMESEDFSWEFITPDCLRLEFELPRGCYATSLLREFVDWPVEMETNA